VILDSYSTSGKGVSRAAEPSSGWKRIYSRLRVPIPTASRVRVSALAKLIIATCNILPEFCPVELAGLA